MDVQMDEEINDGQQDIQRGLSNAAGAGTDIPEFSDLLKICQLIIPSEDGIQKS